MKKILLLGGSLFCAFACMAQKADLKEFAGKYVFEKGEVRVTVGADSALEISCSMGHTFLTRAQGDTFRIEEVGGVVEFVRNDKKQVVAAHVALEEQDIDMEGKKVAEAVVAFDKKR